MTKSARLAALLFAVVPAWGVLALDPTLPQPGKGKSTPAAVPGKSDGPPAAAAAAATPADTTPVEAPPANRHAIPDAAEIAEASKLVDQLYKQELAAARTSEQKKALATRFRQLAAESRPPGMYVLLGRSRQLAADAGDVGSAFAAVADFERAFQIDGAAMDLDAVGRLLRVVRTADEMRLITRHLLGSANQAVAGNRFESARKLIDQAVTLSVRIHDPAMARLVLARSKEVREIEAAYQQAKPALQAVASKASDPAQNLAAGRYLALYQGSFPAGLPLLAAGSDDPLKELAAKELAGVSGADQQDALGDAWWATADKLSGVPKNHAMMHAGGFYAQAAPSLTGLQQAKAAKRAKEVEPLASLYAGRPASAGASSAAAAVTAAAPTSTPPSTGRSTSTPDTPATPATTGAPAVNINLPAKFTRIWNSPEAWQNKPEEVALKAGRVSILNEGGANTVCENEPLVPQKDGSLVLSWDYGPDKTGYEVWTLKDGELVINRWNSKAELDSGRPVRRVGTIVK